MSVQNQLQWSQLDNARMGDRARPINSTSPWAVPITSAVSSHLTTEAEEELISVDASFGSRIYVTKIMVTNGDSETGTFVELRDGSAGTVIWEGYAAPAGGGFVVDLSGEPLVLSDATALYVACADAGADVVVCVAGYYGD